MRCEIDGHVYNTARSIALFHYGSPGDIEVSSDGDIYAFADAVNNSTTWWEAAICVTKKGRYFMFGRGGPDSIFGQFSGVGIVPISEEEARAYAENFLSPERIEEIFRVGGPPPWLHRPW